MWHACVTVITDEFCWLPAWNLPQDLCWTAAAACQFEFLCMASRGELPHVQRDCIDTCMHKHQACSLHKAGHKQQQE